MATLEHFILLFILGSVEGIEYNISFLKELLKIETECWILFGSPAMIDKYHLTVSSIVNRRGKTIRAFDIGDEEELRVVLSGLDEQSDCHILLQDATFLLKAPHVEDNLFRHDHIIAPQIQVCSLQNLSGT